ncbi:MAG: NADH-quinone oxidoreductase subunit J [Planctomycetota bacterium]
MTAPHSTSEQFLPPMVPTIFYAACAAAAVALLMLLLPSAKKVRTAGTVLGLASIAWILVTIVRAIPVPDSALGNVGMTLLCAFISVAAAVRVITHHRPVYSALYFVLVVISGAALYVLLSAEFVAFSLLIVYAGAILITYLFVLMLAQQSPTDTGGADAVEYDRVAREPAAAVTCGFVLLAVLGSVIFAPPPSAADAAADQVAAVERAWADLGRMPDALLERARRTDSQVRMVVPRSNGAWIETQRDFTAVVSVQRGDSDAASDLVLPPSLLPENTARVGMSLVTRFPVSLELAGVILLMAMLGAVVLARRQSELADDERRALAGLDRLAGSEASPARSRG